MPPTTIAQTNERIDNLHKHVNFLLKLVGSLFVILFVPWISWVSISLNSMNGDIHAIKQAEKNNGTEIVSRLEKPPSLDQLKHDLAVTSAKLELQNLTIDPKTKVEPSSYKGLETALLQVTKSHPDLPQAWNAAAQLVSYKSATSTSTPASLPPCDMSNMKPSHRVITLPNGVVRIEGGYFFANCTLTLEDLPPQPKPPKGKFSVVWPTVILDNGVVIYRGGELAEGNDAFTFYNCRFEMGANAVPAKPIQDLLEAALKQGNLQRVEVNLPDRKPA
jgi:hypothetical protein